MTIPANIKNRIIRAAAFALMSGLIVTQMTAAQAESKTKAQKVERDYDVCLGLLDTAPEDALAYARDWQIEQGPQVFAARHCAALAQSALGWHEEAASTLSGLALAMKDAPKDAQAEIFAQVADAWVLAGNGERARVAIDQALALDPRAQYLMSRANIRAVGDDWDGTVKDTGAVLEKSPNNTDALTLRATALRNMGHPKAALMDASLAVELSPHHLGALLERGRAKAALLDLAGARADWESVVRFANETGHGEDPRAQAAQDFLDASVAE
tara:strand:- start:372289 stop:373101 length:813 start_codon:yes stop_codon:yes gene_type:complete